MRLPLCLFLLLVLLTPLKGFSDSERELEVQQAWERTGYGIDSLFAESDFNPAACMNEEKVFVACLSAIDQILANLSDGPLWLATDKGLQTAPAPTEQLDGEAARLAAKARREQLVASYSKVSQTDLVRVFDEVQQLALTQIPHEKQALVAGAAYEKFLTTAYDPHWSLTPDSLSRPKPNSYVGIGSFITPYSTESESLDGAIALKPMEGSPAEIAGIVAGDLLIAVDGQKVRGLSVAEVSKLLKGPEGTSVVVTIESLCDKALREVRIQRAPVKHFPKWVDEARFVSLAPEANDSLTSACRPKKTEAAEGPVALYAKLPSFMEAQGQDLCGEFIQLQLKDLRNRQSQGIIIDLRDNGGGQLDVVACMLDSLIMGEGLMVGELAVDRGRVVGEEPRIGYEFTRDPYLRSGLGQPMIYNRNLTVLVNRFSASASEIFAGTIQDMERGWVVGEHTFGKGTIQQVKPHRFQASLNRREVLRIAETTAIYTLASGRTPQNDGITPDFPFDAEGKMLTERKEGEAELFGAIEHQQPKWHQPRIGEVATMIPCVFQSDTNSAKAREKMKSDERFNRPFVGDFQLAMAKDVMACSVDRPDAFVFKN